MHVCKFMSCKDEFTYYVGLWGCSGRSYLIMSKVALNQCIESLTQKCQPGVVVHFEKIGPDPGDGWYGYIVRIVQSA